MRLHFALWKIWQTEHIYDNRYNFSFIRETPLNSSRSYLVDGFPFCAPQIFYKTLNKNQLHDFRNIFRKQITALVGSPPIVKGGRFPYRKIHCVQRSNFEPPLFEKRWNRSIQIAAA